ncbi:MAG: hypothetical protein IJ680_04470, partial [Paludibacteraceae bacterium]|nr:hypothetical protein [Paludibacteraceae bacterium]
MSKLVYNIQTIENNQTALERLKSGEEGNAMLRNAVEYMVLFDHITPQNVLTFFSFDQSGCLFTFLHRTDERISTVNLFIPRKTDIDAAQTASVITGIKKALIENDVKSLDVLVSRDYPQKKLVMRYMPSTGNALGLRQYNSDEQLHALLGGRLYQTYYKNYRCIFLLDRREQIEVNALGNMHIEDLTNRKLNERYILLPPPADATGYQATVEGRPFVQPIAVPKDANVQIKWVKEGAETIEVMMQVTADGMQAAGLKEESASRELSATDFVVSDDQHKQIDSYSVIINGKRVDTKNMESVCLQESELSAVKVHVHADGYSDVARTLDLNAVSLPIRVSLEKQADQYRFVIAGNEFTMWSREQLTESPIPGYEPDSLGISAVHPNHMTLVVSGKRKWMYALIGLLAGFFFGVCVAYMLYSPSNDKKGTQMVRRPVNAANEDSALTMLPEADVEKQADEAVEPQAEEAAASPVSVEQPAETAPKLFDDAALREYLESNV